MKTVFRLCFIPLSLLILAGCASSDRMRRLSGGIIGEYSAPQSHRLRSERFQSKSRIFSSANRSGQTAVAGLEESPVNLWPFFVRTNQYSAVLWPFMDFDPYGLAIRPFYNQEGDEYSVLVPLSAWNPVNGDGWVLTALWGKDFYAFLPLAWQSRNPEKGVLWYTPLVIHCWDYRGAHAPFQLQQSRTFTEIMLAYYGKTVRKDNSEWAWLFTYGSDYPDSLKRELAYRFAKTNRPVPQNFDELKKLRTEVFAGLPEVTETKYGFFPLFHATRGRESRSFNVVGPLFGVATAPGREWCGLLHWLGGEYDWRAIGPRVEGYERGRELFFSVPLLSRFVTDTFYEETPEVLALRRMASLGWQMPFERYKPEIEAELKKIDPALKLPATVTDGKTLSLYLADFTAGRHYAVRKEYSGGFLPLFLYDFGPHSDWWLTPALLTGGSGDAGRKIFWSVPLLTYVKRSPERDVTTVAGPVGWYNRTRRVERIDKRIHSRNVQWTKEWNTVEFDDTYAALGFYYQGHDVFYVAKEGVDAEAAEKARSLLYSLVGEKRYLEQRADNLRKREFRNAAWQTRTKIEYYRQQIEVEEIKIEWENYRKQEAKYLARLDELKTACKKIGFPFRAEALESREASSAELEKLFDFAAERRAWEDFGNGLFFRKELYSNGDYKWHVLGILAGGMKQGDREDTQVLHFLYRFRREGNRSEEMIFPFISIQHDGADKRMSFLWRVFERTERDGRTSGHILFIPY